MEPWHIVELLVLGLISVVAWIIRGHHARLRDLERSRQTNEAAAKSRDELRDEIKDLRMDIRQRDQRINDKLDTVLVNLVKNGGPVR